jgi:hypothetical protein
MVRLSPRPFYPQENGRFEVGWDPELDRKHWKREKSLLLAGG